MAREKTQSHIIVSQGMAEILCVVWSRMEVKQGASPVLFPLVWDASLPSPHLSCVAQTYDSGGYMVSWPPTFNNVCNSGFWGPEVVGLQEAL